MRVHYKALIFPAFASLLMACGAVFAQSGNSGGIIDRFVGPGTTGTRAFQDFTRSTPAPGQTIPVFGQAPCAATTLTWSVNGNVCSASAPNSLHQGNSGSLVDNTEPTKGNATFSCLNGVYSENAGSTCVAAANCPAGAAVSWTVGVNTCTGTAPTTIATGATSPTVTDSTAPTTGSAQFTCNNGAMTQTAGATCTSPNPCTSQGVSWTVGGITCTGTAPNRNDGQVTPILSSTNANTGSARFTCNNGTYFQTPAQESASSCTAPAAGCGGGQYFTWTSGGNTCEGFSTAAGSGSTITISDGSGPTTGTANLSCNNGTFTITSSNCSAPTGNCPAGQYITWSSGPNTCEGFTQATNNNQQTLVTDNSAPTTGTAGLQCSNGSYAMISSNCSAPANANCAGTTVSWTRDGGATTCSAAIASTPDGATTGVSSTNGNVGNADFTCNNGTFTQGFSTCTRPAGASGCTANQPISWSQNGNVCNSTTIAMVSGSSQSYSDPNGPTTGTATFSCFDGVLSQQGAGSCSGGSTSNCNAGANLQWSVGATICNVLSNAQTNGSSQVYTDSTSPNTGSATYSCNNGTFTLQSVSSCSSGSPPPATPCPAGANLQWSVGATICNVSSTSQASGSTQVYTDSTSPNTGSATYSCNNGSFTLQSVSSCSSGSPPPPSNCSAGQPLSWTSGSSTCTATSNALTNGQQGTVTDSTAPTTGTAAFDCSNGSFVLQGGATCTTSPSGCSYPGGFLPWSVGSSTCGADPGPISDAVGASRVIQDNSAPDTGSITVTCQSNGSYVPSSPSCISQPVANNPCNTQTVNWTGSASCSGTASSASNGQTVLVNSTSGNSGSANFTCSNGSFLVNSGASCAASGPVRVAGPIYGGFDNTIVNFKNGTDDLFYIYTFEIYSNGSSAAPTIRYAAGHAVEGGGSPYNLGRPAYQLEFSTVQASKIRNVTLPTSVSSPMVLGDSDLDSNFGPVRAYVTSGGCSGSSCTYSFVFHAVPPSANHGSGNFTYISQPNTFISSCPSGGVTGFDFQGDPGASQYFYTSLEEPGNPGGQQCYSRTGDPAGYDINGNVSCPAGHYPNPSYGTCHAPIGTMGPRVITQRWIRTVNFTR